MAVVRDFKALLSGSTWSGSGFSNRSAFVTFSFETAAQPYLAETGHSKALIASFQPFGAGDKQLARDALQQWDAASGIHFFEVPARQGDIRFTKLDFSLHSKYAGFSGYAYYPNVSLSAQFAFDSPIGGDVFINTQKPNSIGLLLHEIGHALGLKHPFEGDPTLASDLDNKSVTVMSYTGQNPVALGSFDLQAARYLYGQANADGTHVAAWSWNAATFTLTQTGGSGNDTIRGVGSKDVMSGMGGNDILSGGGSNDKLDGGAGNNSLFGGAGNDVLRAGTGKDLLNGGEGADNMAGGAGDDTYYVDNSADKITEAAGGGVDWVWISAASYTLSAAVENAGSNGSAGLTLIGNDSANTLQGGQSNDTLFGRGGDDTLHGLNGNDTLGGEAGDDYLAGGDGNDVLAGGAGSDTLDGGAGVDLADFRDKAAAVSLTLTGGTYAQASVGGIFEDWISGIENVSGGKGNDALTGDASKNVLIGNAGNDTLVGGGGNDVLAGGSGKDTLTGGAGKDVFRFDAALVSSQIDSILDFAAPADTIQLENAIFTTLANVGALSAASFFIGNAAHDASDRIIYNSATGSLIYDLDGKGGAAGVQFAKLGTGLALTAADFDVA